jgi:TRAP-type C4-dicarboxylate transport system permease small subunit
LPARARQAFELFSDLVTIATCVALAVFAWPVMTMLAELDQRSSSANIPLVIPQAAVPAGLLLMALLIAVRLYLHGTRQDDVISSRSSEQ